jgi:hypothetical protein
VIGYNVTSLQRYIGGSPFNFVTFLTSLTISLTCRSLLSRRRVAREDGEGRSAFVVKRGQTSYLIYSACKSGRRASSLRVEAVERREASHWALELAEAPALESDWPASHWALESAEAPALESGRPGIGTCRCV